MPWNWPRHSLLHEAQADGDPLSLDVLAVNHTKDGEKIELAHVRFAQDAIAGPLHMNVLHQGDVPASEDLRRHLHKLEGERSVSLRQVNAANKLVGDCSVKAIKQFAKREHFSLDDDIDLVGSSGCLVDDQQPGEASDSDETATPGLEKMELGDLSILASKTAKTAVGSFHDSSSASGLPRNAPSENFESLLAEQEQAEGQGSHGLADDASKGPLGVAFAAFEGYVGKPLCASDDDGNERTGPVGHVQAGDNAFELRRKVARFWGDCPGDVVGPTRQLIVQCEC